MSSTVQKTKKTRKERKLASLPPKEDTPIIVMEDVIVEKVTPVVESSVKKNKQAKNKSVSFKDRPQEESQGENPGFHICLFFVFLVAMFAIFFKGLTEGNILTMFVVIKEFHGEKMIQQACAAFVNK